MKPYRLHIFVCEGKRCAAKGSEEIREIIKQRVKDLGLRGEVRTTRSGCTNVCKETDIEGEYSPVIVMYPEGVWYKNVTKADIDDIIEKHVKKGEIVERLVHFNLSAQKKP